MSALPRGFVRGAWVALALAALVFLARALAGDVYRVESGSMRPTLWDDPAEGGGDCVLVTFGGVVALERGDLVVLRRPADPEPYVKRVAGLPGETVRIDNGHLWIDGERRSIPEPPAAPIEVVLFDGRRQAPGEFFATGPQLEPFWSFAGAEIALDTGERAPGDFAPALREKALVEDAYLDLAGRLSGGSSEVDDLAVHLDLWVETRAGGAEPGPCGTLRIALSEGGDEFHCTVEYAPGAVQLRLARALPGEPAAELEQVRLEVRRSGWHALRFANVADRLSVDWEGRRALEQAVLDPRTHEPASGSHQLHRKPRVALAGRGAHPIRIADLVVARTLYYTGHGSFATREPLTLGPDEYFLLGDNSSASRDGREWGPVRGADLVGRVRAVVWPLERARWLGR